MPETPEPRIAGAGLAAHGDDVTIVSLDPPFVDERGRIVPLVEADSAS